MGENNGMIKVEAHIKDRFKAQKSMKEIKMLHERGMTSEPTCTPVPPSPLSIRRNKNNFKCSKCYLLQYKIDC